MSLTTAPAQYLAVVGDAVRRHSWYILVCCKSRLDVLAFVPDVARKGYSNAANVAFRRQYPEGAADTRQATHQGSFRLKQQLGAFTMTATSQPRHTGLK